MPKLYTALKASYGDKHSLEKLAKHNYVIDKDLSNDNEQVFYNNKKKKLLYTVAGTHNIRDVGTDIWLAAGHLKDTNRYKEAGDTLEKAKKKYNPLDTTVAGHSLGATIAGYIGNKKDKIYSLDAGYTIGQKTRPNNEAYRTSGDAVSLLGSGAKHMTTLYNPRPTSGNILMDTLKAHDVSNIKDQPIFV